MEPEPEPEPTETPVQDLTLTACDTTGHHLLYTVQDHDLHDRKRARHLYPGGAADVYRLILLFESCKDCLGIARPAASKCSSGRQAAAPHPCELMGLIRGFGKCLHIVTSTPKRRGRGALKDSSPCCSSIR